MTTAEAARGVPARAAAELEGLAEGVAARLGPHFQALLAVGSVGRAANEGAGGTRVEDYDLIAIARGLGRVGRKLHRRALDRWLAGRSEEFSVPVSVGILHAEALPRLPFTLFNYEMRHAHLRLAGGDPTPSLPAYPSERMPVIEATRLLLNRGVLLWGDLLALRGGGTARDELPRVGLRNRKALLAIGDALLISDGLFHWSYAGRLERLPRSKSFRRFADVRLAERYAEAMAAKIEGLPAASDESALLEEATGLFELHARVLRATEERRLGRRVPSWAHYAASGLDYPAELAGAPALRLARLWKGFGGPRGNGFYRRNRAEAAEAVLLRAFASFAYEGRTGDPRALAGLLNWSPPSAVAPLSVWERLHAAWARGH